MEARGGVIVLPKPIDDALSMGVLIGTLCSEKRGLGKLPELTVTLTTLICPPEPF